MMTGQAKTTFKLPWYALILVVSVLGVDCESCIAGEFLVKYTSGGTKCIVCKNCPPGLESNFDCDLGTTILESEFKKLKCVPCEEGVTYQESTSYKECSKCTMCPPGTIGISPCTKIQNTRCKVTIKSSTPKIYILSTLKPTVSNVTKPTPVETRTSVPIWKKTTIPMRTISKVEYYNDTYALKISETRGDGVIWVSVSTGLLIGLFVCGVVVWWHRQKVACKLPVKRCRPEARRYRTRYYGRYQARENGTRSYDRVQDIEMQEINSSPNTVDDAGGNDIEMQESYSNPNTVTDFRGNDVEMQESTSDPNTVADAGGNGSYGFATENTTLNNNEESDTNDLDYELKKELTIKDLDIGVKRRLAPYLGKYNDAKFKCYYEILAEKLSMTRNELTALGLHKHGGGCPADQFLKSLFPRKANSKVKDLLEKLVVGSFPESAINVLHKVPENIELLNISSDVRLNLALELTQGDTQLNKDWIDLAHMYKYEDYEIQDIQNSIKYPNSNNPSMTLLQQIATRHPNMKLVELAFCIGDIGCDGAKNKLEEYIGSKVEEKKCQKITSR